MEPRFFSFLDAALAAVTREVPLAHQAMSRVLGARIVAIEADGALSSLLLTEDGHRLGVKATASVELRLGGAGLLDILEGRSTLLGSIFDGSITLRGDARDLAAFQQALTLFVQGLARSLSAQGVLRTYLAEPAQEERMRIDGTFEEKASQAR